MLRFSVGYEVPVESVRDAWAPDQDLLLRLMPSNSDQPGRALVYLDAGVAAAWPVLTQRIGTWFSAHADRVHLVAAPELVRGGEAGKDGLAIVHEVASRCAELGLDRHSYLIAIGGGAVLDAIGLAAALIHRGLRLIRLPTTTLGQCDAGLGVKNAVNAFGQKNFLGTVT